MGAQFSSWNDQENQDPENILVRNTFFNAKLKAGKDTYDVCDEGFKK